MELVRNIKFRNAGTKVLDKDGKPVLDKNGKQVRREDTVYVGEQLDITVKFGEEVDIPEVYTRPKRAVNGDRYPSPIEQLAPQLEPVDPAWAAEWRKIPPEETKKGGHTVSSGDLSVEKFMAAGLPRPLAEQMMKTVQLARQAPAGSKAE